VNHLFRSSRLFRRNQQRRHRSADTGIRCVVEELESRDVPAVTLLTETNGSALLADQFIPNNKPILLPLSVTNPPNGSVNYLVSSDNPNLSAELLFGGRSIRFTVSDGATVNGSFTIRLFESVAPLATARLIELSETNFYVGKIFHRVLDNFVIQGGSPTGTGVGGSPLPDLADEFNALFTFASPGIVAMANAGDDNNNSQFFITDPDLPLIGAASTRPQFLNFNHTILGILTDGFDVYHAITQVPVTTQILGTEVSRPVTPITILDTEVFTDTVNGVLVLTPVPGFSGPATITVTPSDDDGPSTAVSFAVTGVDDTSNSRPFLGPIPATVTSTAGQPVTITIPITDIDGDPTTLVIRDAIFSDLPANVAVSINQSTGEVTLTPDATFSGVIALKAGVRDAIDRSGGLGLNHFSNFDTESFQLIVNPAPPTNDPPDGNGNGNPSSPPPVTPPTMSPPSPVTSPSMHTPAAITAEATPAGVPAVITVRNSDGSTRFQLQPFEDTFLGGARLAVADVTNDGQPDVVVVAGFGGSPILKIYDGATGTLLLSEMLFEETFRGGLNLRVGDFLGLGYSQILVGAGNTGGPRVTLYDAARGLVLLNFFAHDENLRGGVTFDVGPLLPGPRLFLVTAVAFGGPPEIAVFDFISDTTIPPEVGRMLTGPGNDRRGLNVRIGEPDPATSRPRIVVSPADGSGPELPLDPLQVLDPDVDFGGPQVG